MEQHQTESQQIKAGSCRNDQNEGVSLVYGPSSPPLWSKTLAELIRERATRYGDREAVIVPWQSTRLSYAKLGARSAMMAKALMESGVRYGNSVGIMAGNCYQYVEIFLGAGRIGSPVAVFNNTFTPKELDKMIAHTGCKVLFIAPEIGRRSLAGHVQAMIHSLQAKSSLRHVVLLGKPPGHEHEAKLQRYTDFLERGQSIFINDNTLAKAERRVASSDVVNLQFTSGTTGLPKAAALTHQNIINNGRFVGLAMKLTEDDVVCCPPPLFHCFGLVIGLLASVFSGSKIVFPSATFDASSTLDCIAEEKATALLGVPAMLLSILDAQKNSPRRIDTVRTGIAAASPVHPSLMARLESEMNIAEMLIAYGMTETSPVTFVTTAEDSRDKRVNTVGRVLPHTAAKVIDANGNILSRGVRGEICTSGYALQKGYWKDQAQTQQVMRQDKEGIIWMHTGDEGFLDDAGYCHVTGRIKDIIIRGGENISPAEIEDCLLQHPGVRECCVVGLKDPHYGEVVSCFLGGTEESRPGEQELRDWVTSNMGRIKAPQHIFWLGDEGVGRELPKTASGKYMKHLIRAHGNDLLKSEKARAKL